MLDVEVVQKIYIDLYISADKLMMEGIIPPSEINTALNFLAIVLGDDCPTGNEILRNCD